MFTARAATLPGTSALPKRSSQSVMWWAWHLVAGHRAARAAAAAVLGTKGGLTDIDDLTLACGKDNRLVTENGWRTRKLTDSARL